MSRLMPRLSRADALAVVDEIAARSLPEIVDRLPVDDAPFFYGELGGMPAERGRLDAIRLEVVELATEHGYPGRGSELVAFDRRCAGLLHDRLGITAYEAAQDEVWCGLTVGHLLDVAVWRWNGISDARRVNGDANRDTFRRLWWRAEIFSTPGPELLEDEYVAIMERPFVTGDPRVARIIAARFLHRVDDASDVGRTQLLRETMKLLTRLTPFVALDVLDDDDLATSVDREVDRARTALATTADR